ncbi:Actin-binding Rho-activating protein Striated muscle activator of Rho-dependent signaling [Channa argus]|uniref:Actin-binding Rho-activating protein n=1 Tax=Channa argus TaxID=215402 RepID=A0A6G1PJ40_CHAAH|nr:Actin-binding Rho-activating protein Striated muscle activator of Rho-dependent signaling [Channa argus]
MGSWGTTAISPQEPQGFRRAVQKIKCAAMVANLAKSWQGWASEHADKQDATPRGRMPSSVEEEPKKECNHVDKLHVAPRGVTADAADTSGSKIRTCSVTKTVQPKRIGCSNSDLVNAIRGKIEASPAESKPFLRNESPTRRRQMRALQSTEGGGGWIQDRKLMLQEKKLGSRSSSVDTEDSGLGEEAALSDNSESRSEQSDIWPVKQSNRPKIKIATMGDIRSRWQQWSEQHTEGQKLNPFSEDFDYEYAMAQRLRKGDSGYGRPKDGSKTAERGDRAQRHIHREMEEMVWIIRDMGFRDKEGSTAIAFGRLFDRYVKISDKVVGILLRCRKHKMLDFEGEMLWKGQDDDVIITLRD